MVGQKLLAMIDGAVDEFADGGFVGVGATVGVLSIDNHTKAYIGGSATVYAHGDVFVSAADDTHIFELSGAIAGGFVGVGGAVGVMVFSKDTEASIGASSSAAGRSSSVNGDSAVLERLAASAANHCRGLGLVDFFANTAPVLLVGRTYGGANL